MSVPEVLARMSDVELDELAARADADTQVPEGMRPAVLARLDQHIAHARARQGGER